MKLYISGPMGGYPNFNYDTFNRMEGDLAYHGHQPINPAKSFGGDQTKSFEEYISGDLLEVILNAEGVVVLPGWMKSVGSCMEVRVAAILGKPVYEYHYYYFRQCLRQITVPAELLAPYATFMDSGTDAPDPEPATILEEAAECVTDERMVAYGHPFDNHSRTAAFWSTYLGKEITPEQVCDMNALQKLSRGIHSPKRDNDVDICGYMYNKELLIKERERRQQCFAIEVSGTAETQEYYDEDDEEDAA